MGWRFIVFHFTIFHFQAENTGFSKLFNARFDKFPLRKPYHEADALSALRAPSGLPATSGTNHPPGTLTCSAVTESFAPKADNSPHRRDPEPHLASSGSLPPPEAPLTAGTLPSGRAFPPGKEGAHLSSHRRHRRGSLPRPTSASRTGSLPRRPRFGTERCCPGALRYEPRRHGGSP